MSIKYKNSDILSVSNVAGMFLLKVNDNQLVQTQGYSTEGVGANLYRYDAGSAATIDGVFTFPGIGGTLSFDGSNVFDGTAGTGRMIAVDQSKIDITKSGAIVGAADNWGPIQRSVNASVRASTQSSYTVHSDGKSPDVYVPRGVYDISKTISVPGNPLNFYSSIRIYGDGKDRSVIRAVASATSVTMPYMIDFLEPTATLGNSYWHMCKIGLEGTNPWSTGDSITGVNMMKSSYATIDDCMFRYFDNAIEIRNWSNIIKSSRFEYCTNGIYISNQDGINGQSTINDLIFTSNSFGTVDYCIRQAPSLPINYLKITDNQFDGVNRASIVFNGPIALFQIHNNYFELQGTAGPATVSTNNSGGTTTCNGAIVMHPTTDNVSSANGSITGNLFINCNTSNIVSTSGNKWLTIENNSVSSGSVIGSFVDIADVCGIPSGPLPYTVTDRIYISGTRNDIGGNKVLENLVTTSNADSLGVNAIVIHDNTSLRSRGFCLNDPADFADLGGYTGTLVKSRSPDGCIMFTHNVSSGNLGKEIVLTVDENSPLSGDLLRFTGMVMSDDAIGSLSVYVTWDVGGTPVATEHKIASAFTNGVWQSSYNATYRVPIVTGSAKQMSIRLYRTTAVAGGTNVYLKNFAICSASYERGQEPVLLAD